MLEIPGMGNKHVSSEIYKRIDDEAAKVNPGSDGLIVLPHFSASAVPYFNPDVKGDFSG